MPGIDLYAGVDGWSHGEDAVGIELDANCVATRRAAGLKTIQADVAALDPSAIGKSIAEHFEVERLDFQTASAPCTPFSTAGRGYGRADREMLAEEALRIAAGKDMAEREWNDERSPLTLEPLRWALALEPTWIAWEQVQAVLDLWVVCGKILKRRGWSVWTGLVDANDYGVPQTRKRAILVASRATPAAKPPPTQPGMTMVDAMPGLSGRALALRMGSQRARGTRRTIDQPAPTIMFGKSSSGVVWELPSGEESVITREQAAVLQGFPRDYPFTGGRVAEFQQVGNAVPPPMGRAICESIASGALIG